MLFHTVLYAVPCTVLQAVPCAGCSAVGRTLLSKIQGSSCIFLEASGAGCEQREITKCLSDKETRAQNPRTWRCPGSRHRCDCSQRTRQGQGAEAGARRGRHGCRWERARSGGQGLNRETDLLGLRITARTVGQLLSEPRSLRRFPGRGMTGSGLPVHFTLGSLQRAPSCTPGHEATGTDQCSRFPRTPPHPTSPCSHLTSHVWPLRAPELESPDMISASLDPAGNATHSGRGEPLRAGHREPQLPVRLPVQLICPQEARPYGRKWGAI